MGLREHMAAGLRERARVSRWWYVVAVQTTRLRLAALLASAPALLLFAAAFVAPAGFHRALIDPQNVSDMFSRFVSGIATASSIAVSIAVLTLRRDLRGIRSDTERQEENESYRRAVRERIGTEDLPLRLGPFMERTLLGLADEALAVRRRLDADEAWLSSDGITLAEHLETLERRAREQAKAMAEAEGRPDHLLGAALDLESQANARLARRFARMERLGERTREAMEELRGLLDDVALAQRFMKTLDIQWSLSRMCIVILVSTIPATAVAAAMTLTFGEGAIAAFGEIGAAAIVCAAFAVVLFPIACFVSYILRFLVVNQHTLPAEGFLFGPEAKLLRD